MEKIFKSAMDKVKAEDTLNEKTRTYLMDTLSSSTGREVADAKVLVRTHSHFVKKIVAAACIFVLLCGISVGAYAYYTPASYLSIDINPSVELGVNAFGKVVSVTAYNDDGKTILAGQNVTNMNVADAVNVLVQSAIENDFVVEDGSTIISITSETDNDATAQKLQENAEEGADNAVQASCISAGIYKDNVALERRDSARTLGISPGKLNLIQKLQALDPTISVDDYKDATVTEIMKKFVELKKASMQKDDGDSEESTSPEESTSSEESTSTADEESLTADTSSEKGNGNGNTNSSNDNSNQDTNDKQNGNGSDNGNSNRSGSKDSESGASQEDSSKSNGQGNGNGSQSQGSSSQGNGNGSGNSSSGNSNGKGNK